MCKECFIKIYDTIYLSEYNSRYIKQSYAMSGGSDSLNISYFTLSAMVLFSANNNIR